MSASKHYSHAPLKEVAFEIGFAPRLKVLESIADFQDEIADQFPKLSNERLVARSQEAAGNDTADKAGFRWIFEDECNSRMIRVSIVNFNYVEKNYNTFADFSDQLASLWKIFVKATGQMTAIRVGLRYVNRFDIPIHANIGDLLRFTVPYQDLRRVEGYETNLLLTHAQLRQSDTYITIRSGIESFKEDGDIRIACYLLDYDCFQHPNTPIDDLAGFLDSLHETVEQRFNADITDDFRSYMETGKWPQV